MNLEDIGWNSFFSDHYSKHKNESLIPARVSFQSREIYRLISEEGELPARIAGSLRYDSTDSDGMPVCGDWVLADRPQNGLTTLIRLLLPRKTSFYRKQAGTAIGRQVIASNIDTVCLVSGLDADFNPRRIERYLAVAWESGADPAIILNKADTCTVIAARLQQARSLAPGIPVHAVSAVEGYGMECFSDYAGKGRTIALLGSSGVGKSSIINRLLGRKAQDVRETDVDTGRGKHTTSARHLFFLPSGGLIMDTPGMRELQVWSLDTGLDSTFEDIQSLAEQCQFRDCSHRTEPGCRVRDAIARGELDPGRLAGYFKLSREARYSELKSSHSASWVEKERWKKVTGRSAKKNLKDRRFRD
ncbi:MAG: ribosome small subunit-dependent GTPase A [Acidobacteria bacterium]|nr:ribosome small subunit-dependent GTPase A [Acidobacteriota bacterium]